VGKYGGEPTITSDAKGVLYSTYLSDVNVYRSANSGSSWAPTTIADSSTGDDCVSTDQSRAVYWCNLFGNQAKNPLEADVWKSVDQGQTWKYGENPINLGGNNACGTSCSPFGVDRQWVDGYVLPGGTTDNALVVLLYHDFYGPSQIWVNISQDGGKTFGPPEDILANLNPAGAVGGAVAQSDSACNTVPAGVRIEKSGPHPGRIYAAWIAADPSSLVTGCNISMVQAFHNLIVAWSDDKGATWVPQLAFDAGPFHDASTPFVGFTLDDQGNPYFGFNNNLNWDPTCASPTNPQTVNCEYDMYIVWSPDGGATWQGGSGLVPGSAGKAFKVNSDTGTHWFPAIAAGDPGQVDVAYLKTSNVIATDAVGKALPGGCFPSPACASTAQWYLWAGQSVDLLQNGAANQNPTWVLTQVTPAPMHTGDICNLGIACVSPNSNRNLADFISETIDPAGCAHINYADDQTRKEVDSADQTSGTCVSTKLLSTGSSGGVPPTSAGTPDNRWLVLLLAGFAVMGWGWAARRRRGA
jgi:hypothetical protein